MVSVIKSAFIAVAQHRGLLQALGQLGCELLLFLLLLAGRPFDSKTSNILSCIIAVVGMISYGQAQTRPHATSRTGSQEVDCSEALLARVFFLGKEIMVVLQLHDYEVRRNETWLLARLGHGHATLQALMSAYAVISFLLLVILPVSPRIPSKFRLPFLSEPRSFASIVNICRMLRILDSVYMLVCVHKIESVPQSVARHIIGVIN